MTATHLDLEARAAAAFLFDHPAGYAVSPHAMLDAALAREMRPPAYSGRT